MFLCQKFSNYERIEQLKKAYNVSLRLILLWIELNVGDWVRVIATEYPNLLPLNHSVV